MEIILKNLNVSHDFMQRWFIDAGIVSKEQVDEVYKNAEDYAMIQLHYYKELSHTRSGSVKNQNLIKERDAKLREHRASYPQEIKASASLEQAKEVWKNFNLSRLKEIREKISENLIKLGIETSAEEEIDSDRNLGFYDNWITKKLIAGTVEIPKGYDNFRGRFQHLYKKMLRDSLTDEEMEEIFPHILNPDGAMLINHLVSLSRLIDEIIEYNIKYYSTYGMDTFNENMFIYQLRKLIYETTFEIDSRDPKPLLPKTSNWSHEFNILRIDLKLVNGVADEIYRHYQVVA